MATLISWHWISGVEQIGTSTTASLQALKAMIDAHVTANPSTALWEVAGSDFVGANYRHVTLRRRDLSSGRICIFCGVSGPVHADATTASPSTSYIYIGYAPTSAASAPESSPLAGAPFADWIKATAIPPAAGYWSAVESAAGLIFAHSQSDTVMALCLAGDLALTPDGTAAPCSASSGGGSTMPATWATTAPGTAGFFLAASRSQNSGFGQCVVRYNGSSQLVERLIAVDPTPLIDAGASRRQFLPYLCYGDAAMGVPWRLRQIAYGSHGAMGEQILEAGGSGAVLGYGISARRSQTPNNYHTLWAVNFEV